MEISERDVQRSKEAEYLLEHPLIRDAFENVREGLVQGIEMGILKDRQDEREAVLSLRILNTVRDQFLGFVAAGKLIETPTEDF